ncbi:MAG: hypothetical protein LBS05_02900 [Tannerellaceae bacterium]|nr:hypothetical protein [Tannerellaceae bacterium]
MFSRKCVLIVFRFLITIQVHVFLPHNPITYPLISAKDPLISTKDPLNSTKDALNSAKDPLNSAKDALNSTDDALNSTDDALNSADDALNSADDALNSADDALNSADDVFALLREVFTEISCLWMQMTEGKGRLYVSGRLIPGLILLMVWRLGEGIMITGIRVSG